MTDELDWLYALRSVIQSRIDESTLDRKIDDVTWKGSAQHEQRCYRCGLWISLGDPVASIRLQFDPLVAKYVHEGCVRTNERKDPSTSR